MDAVAYELRPEYSDLSGGTVQRRDGSTYDFFDALERGDGTIVTLDPELVAILDNVVSLERADVPEGRTAGDAERQPAQVAPAVAGLSGYANEGRPVDEFGFPIDPAPVPSAEELNAYRQKLTLLGEADLDDPGTHDQVREALDGLEAKDLERLNKPRLEDLADALDVDRAELNRKSDLAGALVAAASTTTTGA